MTVRAYLLVDAAADDAGELAASLASVSLGNCKQLVHAWSWPEAVVHVECGDLSYLTEAITRDLAGVPGVARITTLAIYPEP